MISSIFAVTVNVGVMLSISILILVASVFVILNQRINQFTLVSGSILPSAISHIGFVFRSFNFPHSCNLVLATSVAIMSFCLSVVQFFKNSAIKFL